MPDTTQLKPSVLIQSCAALIGSSIRPDVSISIVDGRIARFSDDPVPADRIVDGRDILVMPGIIDLHGDAFEREIAPRAGIGFPIDLALSSNDTALISNGITTFFYAITDGFEPGVRSRKTVRELLDTIDSQRGSLLCDSKVHIRHELVATDGHDELMGWIEAGRIDLLSLNDHLPQPDDQSKLTRYKAGLARRDSMTDSEADRFIRALQDRRSLGEQQSAELAAACHRHGVPLASHDERDENDARRAADLNVEICEFPLTAANAEAALARGVSVVMGAPNLVRGGSHIGGTSVRDEVASGRVTALVSDYYYPSLMRAPFILDEIGHRTLDQAWGMVSSAPAMASGLGARKGALRQGMDADLIAFRRSADQSNRGFPGELALVMVGGVVVLSRL